MDSGFILDAIRSKYSGTAIVPELTIEDFALEDGLGGRPDEHKLYRRIDALMFDSLMRTAIEIKVSKADFNRDHYWKRRAWQNVTHRFVYAVPHDLDVMSPHGCGLWKIHPDGRIEVVKKAIVSKTPDALPQTVVQRLAYRAARVHGGESRGDR